LYVGHSASLPLGLQMALARGCELAIAPELADAAAHLAARGPFAAVIARGLGRAELATLAEHAAELAPRAALIVLDAGGQLGGRRAQGPLDPTTELAAEVEAAQHAWRLAEHARSAQERLDFTHDSLAGFARALEVERAEQLTLVRRLRELQAAVRATSSLESLAELVARAVQRLLGHGAKVEIVATQGSERTVEALCGRDAGPEGRVELLQTPEGDVGRMTIDVGRRGLSDLESEILGWIVTMTGLAAYGLIRRRERDEAHVSTIFALARLAEKRDCETGRHIERVSSYCRTIALRLRADGKHGERIGDQFVEDLVRSAPLHDIGKVGIPDSILLKPGPLTAEEWRVMRTHTTIGAETLHALIDAQVGAPSFLAMGLEIAWSHHERWDGSGYPRGLSGQAIPLAARILAVADCYDALTTRRPYKEPWTHVRAIEWMRAQHGTQFDPDVLAAFLAQAAEVDAIRASLADAEPAVCAAA
jgi:HD-GYP domain-containing protein (c-di-GMP phosphodiesterase class II)